MWVWVQFLHLIWSTSLGTLTEFGKDIFWINPTTSISKTKTKLKLKKNEIHHINKFLYSIPFLLSPIKILLLINISPQVLHIIFYNLGFITLFLDIWIILSRIPASLSTSGSISRILEYRSQSIRTLDPHIHRTLAHNSQKLSSQALTTFKI